MTEPVDIVGAGPAGLACAIVLARGGRSVVVHEMRPALGGRFHGDFQGLENWSDPHDVLEELTATGIGVRFDHHPVHHGIAFDAWGQRYPMNADQPLYYLIHRGNEAGSLDRGLYEEALAAGVEVRFSDRVREARPPAVLAGGPRTADAIACGYVFDTDCANGAWIAFNPTLAPLGYAYLLVQDGRGTMASCLFTDFKHQADYVARSRAFFEAEVGVTLRNPKPFGGYANFRLPQTAMQGGKPVIGEQAGFQDALAGFGLRYALRSGVLAARCLLDGSDYHAAWRRELWPLLRTGTSNRFIFNILGQRGWRQALKTLSGHDTRRVLGRLYRPSTITRLLYPLARWRYRAALRDPSCDHVDCHCVWCQCAAQEAVTSAPGVPT